MRRDGEETMKRIRAAALVEFAAHGLHGTTVERIAGRAGANKQRVYNYFGDKAHLFALVLGEELEGLTSAVPLAIRSIDDVGEFAGHAFDYQQEHPDLGRLTLWEALADTGSVVEEATRGELYQRKVAVVAEAQRAGILSDTLAPAHLMFLLIALTSHWAAAPQIARMLSAGAAGPEETQARRSAVVHAAIQLTRPAPPAA